MDTNLPPVLHLALEVNQATKLPHLSSLIPNLSTITYIQQENDGIEKDDILAVYSYTPIHLSVWSYFLRH
jgi:hypothetical protein